MTRHVIQMSGGLGSFWAAKRVAERHGTADMTLLFADTYREHPDLHRFMDDACANLDVQPITVADGRTPIQVFFDVGFLGNSRVAPCTKHLKQIPCRKWLDANCDPADTVLYIGIGKEEDHRVPGIVNGWEPWRTAFPMCDEPYWDQDQMIAECRALDIEVPELYRLNFKHNNCFRPETRFITDRGIRTLRETCGQSVRVLGRGGGWHEATIQAFGEQPTYDIRLRRFADKKTVTATGDHLWPVWSGPGGWRSTLDLRRGNRIAAAYGVMPGWTVVEVEPSGRIEEVMCAVVPDGHVFTLEGNLLTHNCHGACVRAGHAQWRHLLKVFPEVYAEYEAAEDRFRRERNKDVAFLREQRNGVKRPLPLAELRRRAEAEPEVVQDPLFEVAQAIWNCEATA